MFYNNVVNRAWYIFIYICLLPNNTQKDIIFLVITKYRLSVMDFYTSTALDFQY